MARRNWEKSPCVLFLFPSTCEGRLALAGHLCFCLEHSPSGRFVLSSPTQLIAWFGCSLVSDGAARSTNECGLSGSPWHPPAASLGLSCCRGSVGRQQVRRWKGQRLGCAWRREGSGSGVLSVRSSRQGCQAELCLCEFLMGNLFCGLRTVLDSCECCWRWHIRAAVVFRKKKQFYG